jgi:hypothetical protein
VRYMGTGWHVLKNSYYFYQAKNFLGEGHKL